ncbi:copper resistance protein NlpE N-terminal domain-containing protein [Confluentibacter sediminis]|uniref:copper resistance protein NlpE N-terminal domain-containing protein n=1 Tax=Confluentibacter sediminis TaxID=2219045 RepID=UPI000DAD9448|nr:copper resistance protein NlpE N-terminal domain-containing protein [Confluentibacter sediminis]
MTLFSCNNMKNSHENISTEEMESLTDSTKQSVDWAGSYEGILPCADCKGIKTLIVFNIWHRNMFELFYGLYL